MATPSRETLELTRELRRLAPADRARRFRLLPKDRALRVFAALEPVHQRELIGALGGDRVREVLEEMEPDDRARLLDELPASLATQLLSGLSPRERRLTATVLGYPRNSAGRIMSPEVITLRPEMTVAEALATVRSEGETAETVYTLPVTDRSRA
jgi:magnesium transporter